MTIPTAKNNPENKEIIPKKDVEVGTAAPSHSVPQSTDDGKITNATDVVILTAIYKNLNLRHRKTMVTLCLVLLLLWIIMAAVFGSILLYKYFNRKDVFFGWCNANYVDESTKRTMNLRQKVIIDEKNDYEQIEVPQLGDNHPGSFVHDFRQNLTAIVDASGRRCFIKPLDRTQVSPPNSFVDFVRKAEKGYYALNTPVIRENFSVRPEPMSRQEMNDLGSFLIGRMCGLQFKTYLLEKKPFIANRRRRAADCEELKFVYYNANGAVIQEKIYPC